ncbi:hypothetical protein [Jiella sp. M17.18]|uniref:hypothetical protein n=1 Tax=Jiella sp. M17.18 TaxID=3234247 RepID=UPI0034DE9D2B
MNRADGAMTCGAAAAAGRPARMRTAFAAGGLAALAILGGCSGSHGQLPPVFGAVFGVPGAETVPYRLGQIPKPVVEPGDRVLGLAANQPSQCIYVRGKNSRRFVAPCPQGYQG